MLARSGCQVNASTRPHSATAIIDMTTGRHIQVVAHRGNAAEFPENSLPAIRSALELGAPVIQIDVQLSSDCDAVVIHDAALRRTAGIEGSVLDLQVVDACAVEVAERARFGDRFAGVTLSRLSDVSSLLLEWPAAQLFVHLRHESLQRSGSEVFLSAVLTGLRSCIERCIIASADLPTVELARRRGAAGVAWMLPDYEHHSQLKCEAIRPDVLIIDRRRLSPGGPLWRGPWRWMVHEVSTLPQALILASRGVELVRTMRVRAMLRELGINPVERRARSREG